MDAPASAGRRRLLIALAALPAARSFGAGVDAGHLGFEVVFFRQPGKPGPLPSAAASGAGPLLAPLVPGLRRGGYGLLGAINAVLPVGSGATGTARLADLVPGSGLEGYLSIARGQLLVVHLSARYEGGAAGTEIDERRRVKFNERHYFDSPAFGAIVAIAPPADAPASAPG